MSESFTIDPNSALHLPAMRQVECRRALKGFPAEPVQNAVPIHFNQYSGQFFRSILQNPRSARVLQDWQL